MQGRWRYLCRFPRHLCGYACMVSLVCYPLQIRRRDEACVSGHVSPHVPPLSGGAGSRRGLWRSEEHTSELQSRPHLVCRLLLEKKKNYDNSTESIPNKPRNTSSSEH